MPGNFAQIEFVLRTEDNAQDILQEEKGCSKNSPRKKLVVRIADTDGAICAQAVRTKAIREKLKDYPNPQIYEDSLLPRWRHRWRSWRKRALGRKKAHADQCLWEIAHDRFVRAMRGGNGNVAIEPHPPAPLRLMESSDRFEVWNGASQSYKVRVCVYELDGILGDPLRTLVCVM